MYKYEVWAFFDGACQGTLGMCGGRDIIYLNKELNISFKAGLGESTNNISKKKTFTIWLSLTTKSHVTHLQILGDSKLVIDWTNGYIGMDNIVLQSLYDHVKLMEQSFSVITFAHIYRGHNMEVDV